LGDERQFRFEQMSGYLQNTGNNKPIQDGGDPHVEETNHSDW